MRFGLTEEQEALRAMVRAFAAKEVLPGREERDETSEFPHEIVKQMGGLGLMGGDLPGGAGRGGNGVCGVCDGDRGVEPGGWERGDHCGVA